MADAATANRRVCPVYARSPERPALFSPAECGKVIAWAETHGLAGVHDAGPEGSAAAGERRRHRQVTLTTPVGDPAIAWFADRLETLLFSLNDTIWRFELNRTLAIFVIKYQPGDHVAWHVDLVPDQPDRKLVLLVQLSPPDAYAGGTLEYGTPPAAQASHAQGAVVAFPAWTPHRVAPVVAGIRYAAACIGLGPSFR
jgi:PKHD-type hydroxylase